MDEKIGLPPGTTELVTSAASLNPIGVVKGTLSLIGVESNYSVMERAVARDYEEWVFETLLSLKGDSSKAESDRRVFGSRVDDNEARQKKLDWIIEEFQKRLGDAEARIGDLMALFEAGYEVWKLNMQPEKRRYLSVLMRKAFDLVMYKEGAILEFIAALRQVNSRQIILLQQTRGAQRFRNLSSVTQVSLDLSHLADLKLLVKGQGEYVITEFGERFARALTE